MDLQRLAVSTSDEEHAHEAATARLDGREEEVADHYEQDTGEYVL